ncbi:MAG: hypothetical protein IPH84_15655 [Bacteroidales bacterium]|nr:hypothetical protein [Bacteroidales bacterium]
MNKKTVTDSNHSAEDLDVLLQQLREEKEALNKLLLYIEQKSNSGRKPGKEPGLDSDQVINGINRTDSV